MGGKQLSFADALSDPRLGANRRLEAIGAAIDWAPLAGGGVRATLETTVEREGADRPACVAETLAVHYW